MRIELRGESDQAAACNAGILSGRIERAYKAAGKADQTCMFMISW